MRFAFLADPLPTLAAYKDSTVAMMREAHRRGHEVAACTRKSLVWKNGVVSADFAPLALHADNTHWYTAGAARTQSLSDFDAVLMRQDPPFDMEYVAATWILEAAQSTGAKVFNNPRTIRDLSEKLAINEYPQFTVPMLVSCDPAQLQAFVDEYKDVILKPLDGMGGTAIFRVKQDDPNRNVIAEELTRLGTRSIVAQRYIPEIAAGDKRILLIGGKVVPFSLARIPKAGETRGNLATGGRGVAQPLSARDIEIAEFIAPIMMERGVIFAGIDVIGDYLTEINLTSPTCFVEIQSQTGFDVPGMFQDALERACA